MNPIARGMPTSYDCDSADEPMLVINSAGTEPEPEANHAAFTGGWLSAEQDPTIEEPVGKKALSKPGLEDRKSTRHPVPETQQSCELTVGREVVQGLVMDESRGGFGVVIDRLGGTKTGKKVKLHTSAGWFTVRIVYLKKASRPEGASHKCDTWYRLGLKKVRRSFLF
jgi:hypothetical protein